MCKIRADLSSIPRSKFQRKKSATPGKPEKLLVEYNIEMTMDSAAISFKLVIDGQYPFLSSLAFAYRGKCVDVQYGSVKTEFV